MDETHKPQASIVSSGCGDADVKVTYDGAQVLLAVGGTSIFFSAEDAALLGTQMITCAARIPVAVDTAPTLASVKAPA